MSTSIDTSFVAFYVAEAHQVFQRTGSYLRRTVRVQDGVVGTSATFQKVGKGVATTKARHGAITPMNQTHTAPSCTLADFYAGDYVDKLDEFKIKHDERMTIARGGALALGRKVDDQITTILTTTSQTGVTFTVTSKAAIHASLLAMVEALDSLDVPNDGNRYGALTPRAWAQAQLVTAFNSADFVTADGMSYNSGAPTGGKYKDWLGVKWLMHSGLPGKGTSSAEIYTWHHDAVGYASGALQGNVAGGDGEMQLGADITWHGDRAAHFVNHYMSGQAVMIDDTGVIQGTLDDTAAIATS